MIHEEKIKVSIKIIVEKSGLCAKTAEIKSHRSRFILIIGYTGRINSFTNQKLIFTFQRFIISDTTHINIKQSIIININNRNASAPPAILRYLRLHRYIFKLHSAFIQIN